MTVLPINKYLSQDYRNVLSTSGSPQNINDEVPITPVIDIQKGFPKPSAKQRLRYLTFAVDGTSREIQLITVGSTSKIYLLGYIGRNTGGSSNFALFDAVSGGAPSIAAATVYNEELGVIVQQYMVTNQTPLMFYTLPLELKRGLRTVCGGATEAAIITIYYIEEQID